MAGVPRLLPLVAVAIGGVLAVNAVRGAPNLIGAARSFAEGRGSASPPVAPGASIKGQGAASKPAPVCAPTATDLAKEAGLSPAELQVLQSLGARRGELDQREQSLDTQVQLIAAAEAKLDDRIKQMNTLKASIQDLLGQAASQQQAETDRLVTVYEAMKPKDAAARITLMDDSVRLPMAAKMKPRKLADILAQMPADDAKNLTERLAQRVNNAAAIAGAQAALNPAAAPPPGPAASAAPADQSQPGSAAAKAGPRSRSKGHRAALAASDNAAAPVGADAAAKPATAQPIPGKAGAAAPGTAKSG